uniref:Uncharacterized protein n=1 Tax=Aegilops tauschii subsp. strangulata TaxID=200361 RepID=A0A453PWK8_AEGTS
KLGTWFLVAEWLRIQRPRPGHVALPVRIPGPGSRQQNRTSIAKSVQQDKLSSDGDSKAIAIHPCSALIPDHPRPILRALQLSPHADG